MGYVQLTAHTSSALVEWCDGDVSISTRCLECEDERTERVGLVFFLKELGITEQDCIEAFKEVSDDTV